MSGDGSDRGSNVIQLFPKKPKQPRVTKEGPLSHRRRMLRGLARHHFDSGKGLKNVDGEDAVVRPLRRQDGKALKARGVMAEQRYPKEVTSETCKVLLEVIAPVSDELSKLLHIPEKLHLLGSGPSFSSDPEQNLGAMVSHMLSGTPLPDSFPDYALNITSWGSTVFCTVLDKKRKVIVMEAVNSAYSTEGSWDDLIYGLKEALDLVKKYESQGAQFEFVVSKESMISLL
jgi:hypothetical protein